MTITSWAPTARYAWTYDIGRHVALDVESTTASGQTTKGTMRADNMATLCKRLIARGVPRAEAVRIVIARK